MSEVLTENQPALDRRELGNQERLLHNVHRFGGLIGVQAMEIEGPLPTQVVRDALNWMQDRHPMLQAHLQIVGIGTTPEMPWFYLRRFLNTKGTKNIPLKVINEAGPEDWRKQMQLELKTPITGSKMPLVRATFMRSKDRPEHNRLLIVTDHAIADAQAANMLTCQMLEYFARPKKAKQEKKSRGLPPSMESRLPEKSSDSTRPYQPAIRLPTHYTHPWERQTRVFKHSIPVAQHDKIKRALAEKHTSMHGLLSAIAITAITEENNLSELTILSNVEFRRMCSPPLPEEAFGCYIDIVRTHHKTGKPLWGLAQEVMFKLVRTLARDQAGASVIKMPPRQFYRQEGWAAIKSGMRLDAISVTTAGETDIKSEYGPIKLLDMTMSVSLGTIGASYFLVSLEREGELDLYLCYAYPCVSDEQAKVILDRIIATLNAV